MSRPATFEELVDSPEQITDSLRIRTDTLGFANARKAYAKMLALLNDNSHMFPTIVGDLQRNKYIHELLLFITLCDAVN